MEKPEDNLPSHGRWETEWVSRVILGCSKPPFHPPSHPEQSQSKSVCVSLSLLICLLICFSVSPHVCLSFSFPLILRVFLSLLLCLSFSLCLSATLSDSLSVPPSPLPLRSPPHPFMHWVSIFWDAVHPSSIQPWSKPPSFLTCPTWQPHNLSSYIHSCLPSINPPPPPQESKCFKMQI